jgi:hypothetical protein
LDIVFFELRKVYHSPISVVEIRILVSPPLILYAQGSILSHFGALIQNAFFCPWKVMEPYLVDLLQGQTTKNEELTIKGVKVLSQKVSLVVFWSK